MSRQRDGRGQERIRSGSRETSDVSRAGGPNSHEFGYDFFRVFTGLLQTRPCARHGLQVTGFGHPREPVSFGSRSRARRRRGFSLVELMIVMTIASVSIGLVGVCLQGLYRAEQRTRQQMTRRAALTQLGLRFRSDAHEAARVELAEQAKPEDTVGLVLTAQAGHTVTYHADGGQVERTVQRGGQVVHHDAFRLPGVQVAWELQAVGDQTLAAAVILHKTEPGVTTGETNYEERLEARVGLHQKP